MADDTIQVFEKEHPNSGLPKGNFLVRGKVKKPGHQPHIGEEPKYYATKDMFVGNILTINGFSFHLLNADEFTYSYMEANKHLVSVYITTDSHQNKVNKTPFNLSPVAVSAREYLLVLGES